MNYAIFTFALTDILLQALWPAHSQLQNGSPGGFHHSSAAAALRTADETAVATNEIISLVNYWECLGGKGDWVNLKDWYFIALFS